MLYDTAGSSKVSPIILSSLCHYLCVSGSFWIHSQSVQSLAASPAGLCQQHKHFSDKDGRLFTDEAKVLLAPATVCVCVCVCVCVRSWTVERAPSV